MLICFINFSLFNKLLSKFLIRMSLAMFAAPFDDNMDTFSNNSDNNIINKKRQAHNKTQKKYPKENFDTNKVNSVLEKIHNSADDDSDDNYNFPPKPKSSGVDKTFEQMMNMTSSNDATLNTLGKSPQPNYQNGNNLDLNDYNNYGNNKSNEDYYKSVLPGYVPIKNTNYNISPNIQNQDVLLQKLNYMITLLEDQQDERTNNVTEEVVLYSFLGIFIIFIADSFVRVGKYIR